MTYHPHTPTDPAEDVPPHIPHQRASAETWASARADYEAGASAPVVAERYGLGERWVREKARRENWKRPAARGAGLDDLRARLQLMVAAPDDDLLEQRGEDERLDEIVNDHALEVGRLLMRPTPLDLSRFAFRRAAEAAARGASAEATGWVRLVNAIDRSRPTLELTAHPGNGMDMRRAGVANMLRQLQNEERPTIGTALQDAGGESWDAAEDRLEQGAYTR